jgi:(R,R)-butanediol dehydrogenase/meso-butanediol dehydrogenase/diacetyl reductase
MAEKAIIQESNAIALPEDITDRQGALVEPAAVEVHAVDRAGIKPGDSILITGAGTIGAMTALAARTSGVTNIFVSEPNESRRERLERMDIGVTVLDPVSTDVAALVRSKTLEGVGVDAAVECSGNGRAFDTCIDAVRAQGVVVQVGLMPAKIEADPFRWTVKDLTIRGSLNYPITHLAAHLLDDAKWTLPRREGHRCRNRHARMLTRIFSFALPGASKASNPFSFTSDA